MAPTLVLAPAHDGADPVAFKVKNESNFAKSELDLGDRGWFQRQQSEPAPMKRQNPNKPGSRVPSIAEKLTCSVEQDDEDFDMDVNLESRVWFLRQHSEPAPMKRQLSSKARVPPIAEKLAIPAEQEEEDLETDFSFGDHAWLQRQESEPAPRRQRSKKTSQRVPPIAESSSSPTSPTSHQISDADVSTFGGRGIIPSQAEEPEMEPSTFCFEPEDFEQPEEHGRQISTFSAASGGFCRQETEQYWPMHSSLCIATESGAEVNTNPEGYASVKVMQQPLFVVPAAQMVWPATPNPSLVGTHRKAAKNAPTSSMPKDRRNTKASKSLITQAWEAQQRKKQEQQQQEQAKAKLLFRQLVTGVSPPPKEEARKQAVPRFCFSCGNQCQPHFKFCPFCRTQLV
jgi:hypothetical protein